MYIESQVLVKLSYLYSNLTYSNCQDQSRVRFGWEYLVKCDSYRDLTIPINIASDIIYRMILFTAVDI